MGATFIDRFLVECKSYANLDMEGLITNRGHLVTFWREARTQARRYDKQPMLIARQNRQPVIVCLTREGAAIFKLTKLIIIAPQVRMRIVLFDDFLKFAVKP